MTNAPVIASDPFKVPTLGSVVSWVSFMLVLASWFAPSFGLTTGFFVRHAGDLFGAILLYTSIRQTRIWPGLLNRIGPLGSAAFVFLGCTAVEIAQQFRRFPGWYDSLDIVCYAGGVLVGLVLDARITPAIRRGATTPKAPEALSNETARR